jgi:MFS family permease
MNLKIFKKEELLTIFACFWGIGICYGIQYSFSIFFVEISSFFNSTKAASSLIFSLSLLIYGLYNPVIGILINRFGGRKIFKIASFVIFTGLAASCFANTIKQLYFTLGIITAIGINSVGFIPITIIISNNFPKRKGFALGIATTGVGAGAFIISILSKFLIDRFTWQIALLYLGIFSSVSIFSVSFFLPKTPKTHTLKFNFQILKHKNFYLILSGMALGAMTTQGIMLHIVAFFIEKGIDKSFAAVTISIIALCGSFGKIFWGYLADFVKPIKLYFFACIIILISFFIIQFLNINLFITILFSVLFGLGYGSFAPLFPTLAFEKFKENFGNTMGFLAMGNGIGAFFSTFLLGFLHDIYHSYTVSIYFLILMITLSLISYIYAFKND